MILVKGKSEQTTRQKYMLLNRFHFPILIFVALFFQLFACTNSTEDKLLTQNKDSVKVDRSKPGLLHQIKQLEDSLYASEKLDISKGNRAIALYQEFHKYYWQDTICVDFLFKAAEIADNMGFPQKAIELYQECFDYYPNSSLAPYCLFRVGNIYQFTINDYINAKLAYNDCIKFFPNSKVAEDAKQLLNMSGKNDLDIIREFEKKNGN
jgi:tetratricopeptide (TPR) repeat protein